MRNSEEDRHKTCTFEATTESRVKVRHGCNGARNRMGNGGPERSKRSANNEGSERKAWNDLFAVRKNSYDKGERTGRELEWRRAVNAPGLNIFLTCVSNLRVKTRSNGDILCDRTAPKFQMYHLERRLSIAAYM